MAEQEKKVKGIADIVFLVDATGSMDTCITKLKENIAVFVDSLTGQDPNARQVLKEFRVKAVGYRDFTDKDSPPFVDNPFVDSAAALKDQLAALNAEGGGDEPESLLDALYRVANMDETAPGGPAPAQLLAAPAGGPAGDHCLHRRHLQGPPGRAGRRSLRDVLNHLRTEEGPPAGLRPQVRRFRRLRRTGHAAQVGLVPDPLHAARDAPGRPGQVYLPEGQVPRRPPRARQDRLPGGDRRGQVERTFLETP